MDIRGGRREGKSGVFSMASEGVSTPSGGCRGQDGNGVSSLERLLSSASLLLTRSEMKIKNITDTGIKKIKNISDTGISIQNRILKNKHKMLL